MYRGKSTSGGFRTPLINYIFNVQLKIWILNFRVEIYNFSTMAKLSKILFTLFSTGYSDVNYETVSCNNHENVSLGFVPSSKS